MSHEKNRGVSLACVCVCVCSRQTFHFHSWIILLFLISLKHFFFWFILERWQINEIRQLKTPSCIPCTRDFVNSKIFLTNFSLLLSNSRLNRDFFFHFWYFHTGSQTFFKPVFFSLNDGHCYSTKSRRMAIFTTIKWRIFIFTFLWDSKIKFDIKTGSDNDKCNWINWFFYDFFLQIINLNFFCSISFLIRNLVNLRDF